MNLSDGDPLAALEAYLEPPEPGVTVEVDRDDAAALVVEVQAARRVIAQAWKGDGPGWPALTTALNAYEATVWPWWQPSQEQEDYDPQPGEEDEP